MHRNSFKSYFIIAAYRYYSDYLDDNWINNIVNYIRQNIVIIILILNPLCFSIFKSFNNKKIIRGIIIFEISIEAELYNIKGPTTVVNS